MEGFRAAVYGALSGGGVQDVCPLGLLAGSWAAVGRTLRALALAGGTYPTCDALSSAVLAAVQAGGGGGAAASVTGCSTVQYYGSLPGAVDPGAAGGAAAAAGKKGFPFWVIGAVAGALLLAALAAFLYMHRKNRGFTVKAGAQPGKADAAAAAVAADGADEAAAAATAAGAGGAGGGAGGCEGEGAALWATPIAIPGQGSDGEVTGSRSDVRVTYCAGPSITGPNLPAAAAAAAAAGAAAAVAGGLPVHRKASLPAFKPKTAAIVLPDVPDTPEGIESVAASALPSQAAAAAAGPLRPTLPPIRAAVYKLPQLDPDVSAAPLSVKSVLPTIPGRAAGGGGGGSISGGVGADALIGTSVMAAAAAPGFGAAAGKPPLPPIPPTRKSALPSLSSTLPPIAGGGGSNPFAKPALPPLKASSGGGDAAGHAAAAPAGGIPGAAGAGAMLPGILPSPSMDEAEAM